MRRYRALPIAFVLAAAGMLAGCESFDPTDMFNQKKPLPGDRRAFRVSLTAAGRKAFAAMAQGHEGWVVELLAPLSERPSASRTVACEAPWITCRFVTTCPASSQMNPEPLPLGTENALRVQKSMTCSLVEMNTTESLDLSNK